MPPVPPSPPEAPGGAEPPASVSEAPGEPPAEAHAARMTESTTKRPGAVRFMAAWTPRSAGRFPSIPATMIPMRRTALPLALVLLAVLPATALAHGSHAPAPTFPERAARLALRSARRRAAGRDGGRLSLGRSPGQPRAPRQPAAADPDVAVHERPRRDRRGADLTDRGVRGLPVQRPHGPAPAADARRAAAAAGGRTDHPDAPGQHADDPATPAVGAPQPGREGDLVPGRDLGALRRGELGMALQHALRRGAREPAAPLLPARDLPCGGAAVLVAGRRRRSLAVADAVPGAPLLPLPGAAAELVPRRRAAERRHGPLPALRHEPARPGARSRSRTSSSAGSSCGSPATSPSSSGWPS